MTPRPQFRPELEQALRKTLEQLAEPPLNDGLPTYELDVWKLPCGFSGVARWLKDRESGHWAHVNVQGLTSADVVGRTLMTNLRSFLESA